MSTKSLALMVVDARPLTKVFLVISFTALTALAAQARFYLPFTPVPVTLQSLMVVLSGACLGPWLGVSSQLLLIVLGCLGVGVFSGNLTGLDVLAGPTSGYIFGFVLTAYLVGRIARSGLLRNWWMSFLILFTASFALLIPGVIGLKFAMSLTWTKALALGFWPFIPGDIVKTIIAAGLWSSTQAWLKSRT